MHFGTAIIDYFTFFFLEHTVKVKAGIHEPESTAQKTLQRQSQLLLLTVLPAG